MYEEPSFKNTIYPSTDDHFQKKEQNGPQTFRDMDENGWKCTKTKLNGRDSFMWIEINQDLEVMMQPDVFSLN